MTTLFIHISTEWSFVMALVIGIGFGYILESAGFSSSRKLAGVFYGYDFVVLRVFFTAAIVAGLGLMYFNYLGWLDIGDMFVNKFYVGSTILGGAIMGLGFVIGGFCPGTSACASAIGKIDAMLYLGGFMLGVVIFDFFYPLYKDFYLGGAPNTEGVREGALGSITVNDSLGISMETAMLGFVVVAIVAFYATAVIQKKVSRKVKKY